MNTISAANGADILQRFLEQSGQTSAAHRRRTQPPLCVIGGGTPETTGTLLNTYA